MRKWRPDCWGVSSATKHLNLVWSEPDIRSANSKYLSSMCCGPSMVLGAGYREGKLNRLMFYYWHTKNGGMKWPNVTKIKMKGHLFIQGGYWVGDIFRLKPEKWGASQQSSGGTDFAATGTVVCKGPEVGIPLAHLGTEGRPVWLGQDGQGREGRRRDEVWVGGRPCRPW